MELEEDRCPQCKEQSTDATNRLVQDACGHKKCRLCLLYDVNFCEQCVNSETIEPRFTEPENSVDCVNTVVSYGDLNSRGNNSSSEGDEEDVSNDRTNNNIESKIDIDHIIHNSETCSYTCTICKRSFTSKSQTQYHLYCDGRKKPFECEYCNKGFIIKSHYQSHTWTHENVKPFNCNICNKKFSERSKLNRHKLSHSPSRTFICQNCGKTFKTRENLRTHSLIHKTERPYECTECGAKFSHISNLKKHSAVHTVTRVHMCDQCSKQFKTKWALTVHKRTHLKIRPNQCANCSKSFVHLKDLHRHELIHIDSKEFTCGICGTKFNRKDNLNRHTKNTHPGKPPQIIKIVDNPNAIKVITAPPINANSTQIIKETQIDDAKNQDVDDDNVPIKLEYETAENHNHNIQRTQAEPTDDESSKFNIYEKILLPSNSLTKSNKNTFVDFAKEREEQSNSICQKILGPFNAPAHYETSFDNKKHAVIKNIKFKLPAKYMTQESSVSTLPLETSNSPTTVVGQSGAASVIVNNENSATISNSDVHWRRRTLQNLNTKEI